MYQISIKNRFLDILWAFFKLGLISFGGPIAHIGYFHQEFVIKKKWLSENVYAELVALCNFLPGPSSSQVGLSIGLMRGGYWGAFLAWFGFTLPSSIFLIICAYGVNQFGNIIAPSFLHGLQISAVVIVAHAVLGMFKNYCIGYKRNIMMLMALSFLIFFPQTFGQVLVIIATGILGYFFILQVPNTNEKVSIDEIQNINGKHALLWLLLFCCLFVFFTLITIFFPGTVFDLISIFYRTGASVFGGGHVILPLLQSQLVDTNMISYEKFITGYSIVQTVPGPLFTFSAFIGAVIDLPIKPWLLGVISVIAIFIPSFLLIFSVLPYWMKIRERNDLKGLLAGVNVGVVAILLAALYQPLFKHTIISSLDLIITVVFFILLYRYHYPSWSIVFMAGISNWLLVALLNVL